MLSDIRYIGTTGPQLFDLYFPPDSFGDHRPGIVIIHGGGWRVGDKRDAREVQMAEVLTAAGYVCASINYTLIVDEKPAWPMYLDEAREAVRFLRRNAKQYRIDPARIGAIGGSAGGNIALMLGIESDGPRSGTVSSKVKAIVSLYAVTDMTWNAEKRTILFGCSAEEVEERTRQSSPIYHATADFPPTLLEHGSADALVPLHHSTTMAERLKTLGVPHRLVVIEGAPHTHKLHDQHADIRADVVQFFDTYLS